MSQPPNFTSPSYPQAPPPVYSPGAYSPGHAPASLPMVVTPVSGKRKELFPTPEWRDVWAAVLFYLVFLTFIGFGVFAFLKGGMGFEVLTKGISGKNHTAIVQVLINLGVGLVISVGGVIFSFFLMKSYPIVLMHVSLLFTVALFIIFAILMINQSVFAAVLCFIMSLISLVWYFCVKKRIPFSAMILRMTIDCTQSYPAVLMLVVGGGIVAIIYLVIFNLALVSIVNCHAKGIFSDTLTNTAYVLSVFSLYWTIQVIWNSTRTAIAGVFATFYFTHGSGQRVKSATVKSLNRALTYSFGSICFGSLLVAIIQTIRFLIRAASSKDSIIGIILDSLFSIIESLIKYFNSYAYTQIAIYGKSFVGAASDTWGLFKRTGIEAVVNDNLIDTVCGFISIGLALLIACISFIINYFIYEVDYPTCLVLSLVFGLFGSMISYTGFEVVTAGATALFVCMAEEPGALQQNDPQLYNEIYSKYGNVLVS